ncbi:hypothetical protein CJJ23_02100 [Mycoplasmopsis agassizii]|uniref:PBP domain-containing protein n=1 Tax=Mycoplasmopsis agassizii TaxID=33922 RepID=A0A269TJR0_9BACT|nr:substrate-binding domain-containing protein [Mycoplasmopsis agassizii]PAK21420.1 hypothetical protein CJJ23_02100 [Mycoplasmopsis agassizii]
MKKNKLKLLFMLTPVALFSLTILAVSCIPQNVIDAKGSSSVLPFMAALRRAYQNYDKEAEINIQAGGSGLGIALIAENGTTLGNASKSPASAVRGTSLESHWKENRIKTITLGKDGIVLLMKLPSNLNADDFSINKDNINNLYTAFAGNEDVKLSNFYNKDDQQNLDLLNNINLIPFARSGGANSSGTAEAFLKDSNIKPKESLSSSVKTILTSGDYGLKTKITAEANAEAYNRFKIEGNENGSVIYLSAGYVLNNLEQIKNDGFTLINYFQNSKSEINNNTVSATLENIEKGTYKWVRPFNTMISLKHAAEGTKNFIDYIFFNGVFNSQNKELVNNVFNELGVVELSLEEKITMFKNSSNINLEGLTIEQLYNQYRQIFWNSADYEIDAENGSFGAF